MTTVTHYEIHELAYYFPTTDQEHYEDIKASIAANGQRNPIGVWRGAVIDGKTRYKICQELGIEPKVHFLGDDDDPLVYVVEQNALRRHMTTSQRAMTAARISMASIQGGPRDGSDIPTYTIEQAAAAFGVSPDSVKDARKVIEYGDIELIERCELPSSAPRSQRMAVSNAAAIVESTIQRQQAQEEGRRQADREARAAMAELQRQAAAQIDEAEEKARKAQADADRARYLAEQGLTEQFEEELRKANERAEKNEERRKNAEEARARAEQHSLDEQQNISDERKKLEEERLRLEEERAKLEAQITEGQTTAPVTSLSGDAPPSDPAAITHASVPAIESARNFLDGIELDPLSFDQNTAVQAQNYYTDPEHSLAQQWEAKSLWLELPGQPDLCRQFTAKLLEELGKGHVQQALVLAPSDHTGDDWAQQLIASSDAFCFLKSQNGDSHSMVFLLGDNAQSDVESFAEIFDVLGAVGMSYYESTPSP